MTEHEASRTLVKSPPELWAELSDQASLAGHLAEPFGEIRITGLEPETAIAWEGERASGTVRIEPSGWGTRVTLTAQAAADTPHEHEQQPPAPEPVPLPRPAPPAEPPRGLGARLRVWLQRQQQPEPASEEAPPATLGRARRPPAATSAPATDPGAVLVGVLDKLGAAHHRPFSRA